MRDTYIKPRRTPWRNSIKLVEEELYEHMQNFLEKSETSKSTPVGMKGIPGTIPKEIFGGDPERSSGKISEEIPEKSWKEIRGNSGIEFLKESMGKFLEKY